MDLLLRQKRNYQNQVMYHGVTIHYKSIGGNSSHKLGVRRPLAYQEKTSRAAKKKPHPKTKLGLPDLDHAKAAVQPVLKHSINEFINWFFVLRSERQELSR